MARHQKLDEFKGEMFGYLTLEHAEVIPKEELTKEPSNYLPVQGVIKRVPPQQP